MLLVWHRSVMMYTFGNDFIPPSIHAGGLRYHGMSPIISKLYHEKMIEAQAYNQKEVFEAGVLFAQNRRNYSRAGIISRYQICN